MFGKPQEFNESISALQAIIDDYGTKFGKYKNVNSRSEEIHFFKEYLSIPEFGLYEREEVALCGWEPKSNAAESLDLIPETGRDAIRNAELRYGRKLCARCVSTFYVTPTKTEIKNV